MEIAFAPCPFQLAHFVVVQLAPDDDFELLAADFGLRFFFFGGAQLGFEACLHADAEGAVEIYGVGVAADFWALFGGLVDGEEGVAEGLDSEG